LTPKWIKPDPYGFDKQKKKKKSSDSTLAFRRAALYFFNEFLYAFSFKDFYCAIVAAVVKTIFLKSACLFHADFFVFSKNA